MIAEVLGHLTALVGFDTRNPPRHISAEHGLFVYLGDHLARHGCQVEIRDLGGGSVSLLALRGAPRLLCNCHVDTVPAASGWSADPLTLRLGDERACGLGACDIKGAAACLVTAAAHTKGPLALLFTSDEEAGAGRCVPDFLGRELPFMEHVHGVVVSEPTGNQAVLGHRGIATATGRFSGSAGHASAARALTDSAVHEAVRWAAQALTLSANEEQRVVGGLPGIRFNLGVIEGGQKSNMIADRADVRFGTRPRPGEDPQGVLQRVQALAADAARVRWETAFLGAPLPAPGRPDAQALCQHLQLAAGAPVDFWSEAALFSAAGLAALVYGPGDIAQAHAVDEWVAVSELARAAATYQRLFSAFAGDPQ